MLSSHGIIIMTVIMVCRGYPGQCSTIRGDDDIPLHVMGMHMVHRGLEGSEGLQMGPFEGPKGLRGSEGPILGCGPKCPRYPDPPLPKDMGS